jgi:fused signal recognition particle receptor
VEYVYLIIAIVLVALAALVGLVTTRTRGRGRVERPTGRETVAPAESTDTLAEPELPDVDVREVPEVVTPTIERPESTASRLVRLRQRLSRSQGTLGRGLLALLSRERLDEDTWEDIEDTLLTADVGVGPTQELVDKLRSRLRVEGTTAASARQVLREELLALVDPSLDRSLHVDRHDGLPGVVLMVGVNGTGKTTTVGKLARVLVAQDKQVVLGAADTFRAAAADQLATWGERVGVPAVRGPEGSDPASVAFEAVKTGIEQEADVVLVDTAGRLQNKAGLMDELGKVKRVVEKQTPVSEVLLVLDATTGQNGMTQARVFREVVDVTGIVLTKLDGSAKGGIVIAVQRELGVPVKLVGLGEGADDLAPFDPEAFVDALLGDSGS